MLFRNFDFDSPRRSPFELFVVLLEYRCSLFVSVHRAELEFVVGVARVLLRNAISMSNETDRFDAQ